MTRLLSRLIFGAICAGMLTACGGPQRVVISFATPPQSAPTTTATPQPTCTAGDYGAVAFANGSSTYQFPQANDWHWLDQPEVETNMPGPVVWAVRWGGSVNPVGKWSGEPPPPGTDSAPSGTFRTTTQGSSGTLSIRVAETGPNPPYDFNPDWGTMFVTATDSAGRKANCTANYTN